MSPQCVPFFAEDRERLADAVQKLGRVGEKK